MTTAQRTALQTVVLFGVVSLLADVTYESARSIIGPYLALLGASAAAVGVVSGAGELVGYGVRLLAGRLADRTRRYWLLVWVGYAVNLLAVPLLALAGHWVVAAVLVLLERWGKAVRAPARDALLSGATSQLGHGKGFGIHEALDQIGAVSGPLVVTLTLVLGLGYRGTFAALAVPALAALIALGVLHRTRGVELVPASSGKHAPTPLPQQYWLLVAAAGFAAAGFADFPLLAYHLHRTATATDAAIPLFYAGAMAVDAGAAVLLGWLFDRVGLRMLAVAGVISAAAAPLVVAGGVPSAAAGIVAWGIGMGAHESVLRASVAQMVAPEQRGTAFGVLHAWYGVAWFVGSSLLGVLYEQSPQAMAAVSAALQLVGAVLWLYLARLHLRS